MVHITELVSLLVLAFCAICTQGIMFQPAGSAPMLQRRRQHEGRLKPQYVCAAVIPGNSVVEDTVIGGSINFLQLYNYVITGRVLLSWFPQAAGYSFLRPIYTITDPYLNFFRRLPLQFGGIDLSILPAFFLLSIGQNALGSLAAEIPEDLRKQLHTRKAHSRRHKLSLPAP